MTARKRKCPTPQKLCYGSREAAEAAMRAPSWRDRLKAPTRVYWCRGGHCHLTSRT